MSREANKEEGQHLALFLFKAHPDHTCLLTDIQCILQYIALAQYSSVLTPGVTIFTSSLPTYWGLITGLKQINKEQAVMRK